MASENKPSVTFLQALLPILVLLGLVIYGLIIRPIVMSDPDSASPDQNHAFPLEVVFLLASTYAIAQLVTMKISWLTIQQSIVSKLSRAMPAFFILFSIGMIISSWMICGTIPMLVYYGLKLVDPTFMYVLAFLVPAVFSILTGTSWGSAGAVGIVIIGIAQAVQADLGITAGAVIGGAYFGDKMSPLSDTTNMAALAADVDLFDHIRSMTYTTVPAAVLATTIYLIVGFLDPPQSDAANTVARQEFLDALEGIFYFDPLLLLPPTVVLVGSFWGKPTVPALILSTWLACVLALVFQPFSSTDVLQSLKSGFQVEMASGWYAEVPPAVAELLNRGGLYALQEAIVIAFTVFVFIGTMDCINAIPLVVGRLFQFTQSQASLVLSTLMATAMTNSLTSNQYATSFIVADAFKSRFDAMGIPRRVLSRSLEDTGTMLESVVPWTPSAVFMVNTLGVPYADYWHWQLLSLFHFLIAPALAITGIGCFYDRAPSSKNTAHAQAPSDSQGA